MSHGADVIRLLKGKVIIMRKSVTCGAINTDFPGFDNLAIQKAIDYIASLGGGEVFLSEGKYGLRDSVHLKSNVALKGSGIDRTVLIKNKSVKGTTENFCGYGHKEIYVTDGKLFHVGDGVYLKDDTTPGFWATQTSIVEIEDNILFLKDPLNGDIMKLRNGSVETIFPMLRGANVRNVCVSELSLYGNMKENGNLGGCRGGCIYFIGCQSMYVDKVKITDFNGEGISYQQCCDIRVTNSVISGNKGNGLHPGSGTIGMLIEGCDISDNTNCGIFYCLRIHYNICRNNKIRNNGREGINIGHRDDYIDIDHNEITGNGREGIFFRMDNYPGMSGKYTSVHHNNIYDNAKKDGKAEVYIPSYLTGYEMYENNIGGEISLLYADQMFDSYIWNNKFEGSSECENVGITVAYNACAPDKGVREIDICRIPEKEYRHLDFDIDFGRIKRA